MLVSYGDSERYIDKVKLISHRIFPKLSDSVQVPTLYQIPPRFGAVKSCIEGTCEQSGWWSDADSPSGKVLMHKVRVNGAGSLRREGDEDLSSRAWRPSQRGSKKFQYD